MQVVKEVKENQENSMRFECISGGDCDDAYAHRGERDL